jgi:Transglutaminase-like superfamily
MSIPSNFEQTINHFWNFLRYPLKDQLLFLEVYLLLGLMRLAIKTVKFERLASYFGPAKVESPVEVPGSHLQRAIRIGWAVRKISHFTPWKSNCFPQALAAKLLLRWYGIPSTLYLGAAFKTRTEMEAHAWLRCGNVYVTGGAGHQHFGIVGIFG